MKKQTNPNIKAHLIRSSFYVLLLLAVCVIPFALAQRNTTRRAVTKPTKVAASHRATSATSQSRNDVSAAVKGTAVKGKSKAVASTHFTNAFGRHPGVTSPEGTGACWYDFTAGTATFVPG